MALTDNLIFYFKMDGTGNTVTDEVGTVGDGTSTGTASVTGKIGNARDFDGNDDIIDANYVVAGSVHSISYWVNLDAIEDDKQQVGLGYIGVDVSNPSQINITSNKITVASTGETSLVALANASTDTWYHVVLTASAGKVLKLYIDSVLQDTETWSIDINGAMAIGALGDSPTNTINGSIDEFGYWDKVLTQAEIDSLYNSGSGFAYPFLTAPVAAFSGTPLSGEINFDTVFTDASTETPTSWLWDFGDGGSSVEQSPTHTYNVQGTYTVTLTATNATGNDDEVKTDYITANPLSLIASRIKQRALRRDFPNVKGLIGETQSQEGNITNLVVQEKSLVDKRETVGL